MSKGEIIRSFNSILENFLQQVSPLIGTSYCHYFKQFIKANCVLPIQYFINNIYNNNNLENKILNRDESYFTDPETYSEITKEYDSGMMEIIRLKGIYEQLSSDSKDNVWDISQALLILSKEYLALK
jgi:hypothetical protein